MIGAFVVLVLVVGLVAWIGQGLSLVAPDVAVKFGFLEPRDEIDATLHTVEAKAMGVADLILGWSLPFAALLFLLDHPWWPYLSILGGGIYAYASIVIVLSRVFLKREGAKVGRPESVRRAYVFGAIWMLSSLVMIGLAWAELFP